MAAPTPVERVITVFSNLRNQTSGDLIVPVPTPLADEWGQYFYTRFGPIKDGDGNPIAYGSLTGNQKAQYVLNRIREYMVDVRRQAVIAGDTTTFKADLQTNVDAAVADSAADIGTEE